MIATSVCSQCQLPLSATLCSIIPVLTPKSPWHHSTGCCSNFTGTRHKGTGACYQIIWLTTLHHLHQWFCSVQISQVNSHFYILSSSKQLICRCRNVDRDFLVIQELKGHCIIAFKWKLCGFVDCHIFSCRMTGSSVLFQKYIIEIKSSQQQHVIFTAYLQQLVFV